MPQSLTLRLRIHYMLTLKRHVNDESGLLQTRNYRSAFSTRRSYLVPDPSSSATLVKLWTHESEAIRHRSFSASA